MTADLELTPKARPIRVLPRELAEKIAAGEVIERPSSVVKELVENSIDAGASHIRIEIEEGGRKRIRVRDDGCGIPDAEVLTALERHATSKIDELDDLWNLNTMGFRGEALPSIAAVSRVTIETVARGTAEHVAGRLLYLEGGRVLRDETLAGHGLSSGSAGAAFAFTGTQITVEDLFYNVPARLKFLKSKSGESAQIRELIERIALTHPAIGFGLVSDGRKALNVEPTREGLERVAAILGVQADDVETFESVFEDLNVKGWLDRNGRASNSRYVYLSVNRRMVRDRLLQQAVLVGLRSRMMEGEYPRVFVSVELPPSEIDVNVHPAKSEVRFRKSREVFQVVHGAFEKLGRSAAKPFYSVASDALAKSAGLTPGQAVTAPLSSAPPVAQKTTALEHPAEQIPFFEPSEARVAFRTKVAPPSTALAPVLNPTPAERSAVFSALHYIGQLKNTYLLFQDAAGLIIIDQHAAHERINYERLKARFLSDGLRSQPVLLSIVVKCRAEQIELALEHTETLSKFGFEFEPFGDTSLLLRSIPETLETARAAELFSGILHDLECTESTDEGPGRGLTPKIERILSTTACHSSVRAGQALSAFEATELMHALDDTQSSLNCPHGRPASICLTFGQIEGLFKRV